MHAVFAGTRLKPTCWAQGNMRGAADHAVCSDGDWAEDQCRGQTLRRRGVTWLSGKVRKAGLGSRRQLARLSEVSWRSTPVGLGFVEAPPRETKLRTPLSVIAERGSAAAKSMRRSGTSLSNDLGKVELSAAELKTEPATLWHAIVRSLALRNNRRKTNSPPDRSTGSHRGHGGGLI